MKTEVQRELDAVIAKLEAAKQAAARERETREQGEQAKLRNFLEICENIIRPAMTEFGEYIKRRGLYYQIFSEEDGYYEGKTQRPREASITVNFAPDSQLQGPIYNYPHFKVGFDKALDRVWFYESTVMPNRDGHSGEAGEAALSHLTEEFIQEKLLALFARVFR